LCIDHGRYPSRHYYDFVKPGPRRPSPVVGSGFVDAGDFVYLRSHRPSHDVVHGYVEEREFLHQHPRRPSPEPAVGLVIGYGNENQFLHSRRPSQDVGSTEESDLLCTRSCPPSHFVRPGYDIYKSGFDHPRPRRQSDFVRKHQRRPSPAVVPGFVYPHQRCSSRDVGTGYVGPGYLEDSECVHPRRPTHAVGPGYLEDSDFVHPRRPAHAVGPGYLDDSDSVHPRRPAHAVGPGYLDDSDSVHPRRPAHAVGPGYLDDSDSVHQRRPAHAVGPGGYVDRSEIICQRSRLPRADDDATTENFDDVCRSVVSDDPKDLPLVQDGNNFNSFLLKAYGSDGKMFDPSVNAVSIDTKVTDLTHVSDEMNYMTEIMTYCNGLGLNSDIVSVDQAIIKGDTTESLGFVYKVPGSTYQRNKSSLDFLTPLQVDRLSHLDSITFTFPQLQKSQFSAPKHARDLHYQVYCKDFISAARKSHELGYETKFQLLYPTEDYSTKNVYVVNNNVDMGSLNEDDWYKLAMIAMGSDKTTTKLKSKTNSDSFERRQLWHRDFGYSSQMNTSRQGSEYGVACPKLKSMSDEEAPVVTKAAVHLSKLVTEAKFDWLPGNKKPYNSKDDRKKLFAERWNKDCTLEYMRVNVTVSHPGTVLEKCDVHGDSQNSKKIEYSSTPTLSNGVMIGGVLYRCALVGNSRSSIDTVMDSLEVHGPYVNFSWNGYEEFEDHRKNLNQNNINKKSSHIYAVPSFSCLKQPCNVDPCGHIGTFVEWIARLHQSLNLTLLEKYSVWHAIGIVPHSPYVFGAACQALIQANKLHRSHRYRFNIGFLLANIMKIVKTTLNNDRRLENPPLRHNFYREVSVPSLVEWNYDCGRLLEIGIESHRTAQSMSRSRSCRQKEYSAIRANVADRFPNVQHMIANHLCGIGRMINCLPFWVSQEIEFHQSRPVLWLLDMFHLNGNEEEEERPRARKTKSLMIEAMFLNLKASMETRTGESWPWRKLENWICQLYRKKTSLCELEPTKGGKKRKRVTNADSRFFDVYFKNTNLYTIEEKGINIEYPDGGNKFVEGGLFQHFTWRNRVVDWKTFLQSVRSSELTDGLTYGLNSSLRHNHILKHDHFLVSNNTYKYNLWLGNRFNEAERELFKNN